MKPGIPPFVDPNWTPGDCGCGRHKAGDIGHVQIIAALRTNPVGLRTLLHGLDEAALRRPAPDGGWSIKQLIDHLAACTGTYYQRVRAMVYQEHPPLPRIDRGDEAAAANRDLGEMMQQYASNEARLANLLMSLDDAQWQRTGFITLPDGRTYDVTLDGTMVHAVDHDREHLTEIKRLREAYGPQEQPGGCVCGLHYAGDISHEQMIAELHSHPRELTAMLDGLDGQTLARPAPDGGWSIKQLVGHLRDASTTYLERTILMLNQNHPTMPRMSRDDEANYNNNDLGQMLQDLAASDERFAQLLESLTPQQWQRTGVRKSADDDAELVVDDTAVHAVDHEREHIAEIKKLLNA